jgi:malate dehydrogenase
MMSNHSKVSIIGAGNVGASCAQRIAERGYADVVLLDIIEGLPQGKALDISQSAPILNFNSRLTGTNNYQETADSDVVVIASGAARKPGMSRDDLLLTNMKIVGEVVRNVARFSPKCIIIVATNPVDAMVQLAIHVSRFPRTRVLGLSGVLDSARLSSFIAAELNVSVEAISSCVLGEHGGNMVIIPRLSTVHGKPITEILPQETIDRLVKRTVGGGAEIVGLLKTGSAFYAPSAAITRMVEAVLLDKKEVLLCATCLDGEYGIKDTVLGVPVELGRKGINRIIKLDLNDEEKAALSKAATAVQGLVKTMNLG